MLLFISFHVPVPPLSSPCQGDRLLEGVSHVVVDEVHERTIQVRGGEGMRATAGVKG